MTTPTGRVSCIIVNYNTRDQTVRFLTSLVPEIQTGQDEIIVVDNGSVDGSVTAIRDAFTEVTVIEAGANLGFAKAVNVGAAAARGRYLLLLNPDMVALPGSVDAIVDFAEANPQYRVFGGRTLAPDGTLDPRSCWAAPTLWSLLMWATMLSTAFKGTLLFDPESMGPWRRDTVREVEIITGCLMLIRRDDFANLEGMDELYFLYGEDAEFSLRARARGLRLVHVPSAEMIHEVGGSTDSSGTKISMVLAGKVTMLRQVWPRTDAAIGTGLLLAGVGVRAAVERLLNRQGQWSASWRRRADWWDGYPKARRTLFGLPEHPGADQAQIDAR